MARPNPKGAPPAGQAAGQLAFSSAEIRNELAILNQNLQYPTLAVALQQAALRSSFAALRNSLRTALSAAPTMEEVDLMGWGAGSTIEEGSAGAHETELDIVRAAVDLPGGGVQRQGEPGVEYPWR